ncbi:hypothetical protein [Pedobacter sp. GR22-6]|uniref:hypothetical protein n=1 Tax=Pedobacter sp. GR22-6 TaxID=3127957 RepID=UPI00307ED1A4
MKAIFSILFNLLLLSACGSKSGLVRTGAFYDIPAKFVRSSAGKDFFIAYGKGLDEQECRNDANRKLLKTLIYEGSREGTQIPPALSSNTSIAAFKAEEQRLLSLWSANEALLENKGSPVNRMKQSEEKNTVHQLSFEIGIDRNLLNTELAKFK